MDSRELKITITAVDNATRVLQDMSNKLKGSLDGPSSNFAAKLKSMGNSIVSFSKQAALITAPIVAFGTYSVKAFMDFEDALANVRKTTGATTEQLDGIGEAIKEMAKGTRTSIPDLLKIAEIGGQIGISAKDIVPFTDSINKLNVALGDEFSGGVEQIVKEVGGLRSIFKSMQSDNIANDLLKIGNALNVAGAAGLATGEVMANFAARIGGIGEPLGLTIDQTLGLSAALQELHVEPERGSSAVTRIFQKMGTDIKGFANIAGITAAQFKKLYNEDINGALLAVISGMQKMSPTNVELALNLKEVGLSGVYVSEVISKLGTNIDLVRDKQNLMRDAIGNTNSILTEYGIKNNTSKAEVEKLRNQINILAINLGEQLLPFARDLIVQVSKLADWFNTLSPETKTLAAQMIVFSGVIGPIAATLGTIVGTAGGILNVANSLKVMTGISLGPWGLALVGIVGSLKFIIDNGGTISSAINAIKDALFGADTTAEDFDESLARVNGQLGTIITRSNEGKQKLRELASSLGDANAPLGSVARSNAEKAKLSADTTFSAPVDNSGSLFGKISNYLSGYSGYASGGRPSVGVPSIVGESGPEMFIPDAAGTIIPNHKMGGTNVVVNMNGGMYLDQNSAVMIGDMIIDRLRLEMKVM